MVEIDAGAAGLWVGTSAQFPAVPPITSLTVKHPDGRDLLVFHLDGTVTGDVDDAPRRLR